MRDKETDDAAKLAGCGVTILVLAGLLISGITLAIIYVLFNIGAWIGGQ